MTEGTGRSAFVGCGLSPSQAVKLYITIASLVNENSLSLNEKRSGTRRTATMLPFAKDRRFSMVFINQTGNLRVKHPGLPRAELPTNRNLGLVSARPSMVYLFILAAGVMMMPGYVIHLAEAEQILDRMGCVDSKFVPDNGWKQRFLTGTLLPDTRLKGEKRISHFWNPDHLERLALAPDLSLFLKKYGQSLSDPLILGYLAHLHLDTRYVESYWPTVIQFFGAEGEPEVRRDRITDVEIRHLQIRVPVSVFFSGDYYYGDYSKMNGYFIHKYGLTVPKWEDINDFKMNEVRLKDMERICCELEHLLLICHAGDEQFIQVFDLNCLEQFITETAYEFVRLYKNYLR